MKNKILIEYIIFSILFIGLVFSQNIFSISKNSFLFSNEISFTLSTSDPISNYSGMEVVLIYLNKHVKCNFDSSTGETRCDPPEEMKSVKATINLSETQLNIDQNFNITFINVSDIYQDKTHIIIEGTLFDQLEKSKIAVSNGSTFLETVNVEPSKISVSLINLPSYSTGTFAFYYNNGFIGYLYYLPNRFTPYISSVSPFIINNNEDMLIKGVFFDEGSIFHIIPVDQQFTSIPYEINGPSTAIIKGESLKSIGISGRATIYYNSSTLGISNKIDIGFTLPTIIRVSYDFNLQQLFIIGNFLDSYGLTTTLDINGCAITNVPLLPNFQNSTLLIFNNPKLIFDYCVFKCSNSYSSPYLINVNPVLIKIDKTIERKGGNIYFSGNYLTEYTLKGGKIYDISIESQDKSFNYPCKDIKQIQYIGNQNYLMSCFIDQYFDFQFNLKLNGTFITESLLSVSYQPITINSISSTFYGTPDKVTIVGNSFCTQPYITIGGSNCLNPVTKISLNNQYDQIVCDFKSDVKGINITHTVNILCEQINSYSFDAFLYKLPIPCPTGGSLNKECFGNGVCNENSRSCTCNKGFAGFDCSITQSNPSTPPIPKVNDTITIIETSGNKFDIGIVQIREITFNNIVEKTFNLTNLKWNLQDQQSEFQFIYNTSINTDSKNSTNIETIIKVQISINNNSIESQQYDFLGDIITILPNSVKYQVEIQNWSFNNNLNSIQLIILSQSNSKSNCNDNSGTTNIFKYGEDSIRTLELTLSNGQTLVGTFSNRMKVDDRVIRTKIELLSNDKLNGIPLINRASNNIVSVLTINNFKKNVIIDPSFGLLISNDINTNDSCNDFPKWKIAVIVVCGAVGLSILFIVSFFLYKNFKTSLIILEIRSKLKKW
ncbi:EGF-like domain-containing protein [Dictyostelium discoideum AX4]|uniref:EGF-like domain-containing protein n=1 Tax=Dictyostelium discoideum TaxID=44689 RepID=Q54PD6_DICDI|nr:EGF-like domain-containing protein [Dictyostelium discoideum AX4]EAL65082.1 EGF-like domain-containing protein [Dictyostelium discoideum AX4]|eukprot:XP_638439.1 EGF-like domain-containing protein [Dictyostelium discoideum AX4]